ncbi:hypothetical protein LV476_09350 [Guyparkeria hydrothermalis]|uniref:hypothetical protein n=1 Tax=Guyparkeria hydrothermalis TaxID=923 RepID=UPI002020E3B3|nr:hypothetical protein [Guyparkeria hydrothermalis]MCL7745139.1 hypothetical protein [Guyparkeria hydrothermalis]
MSPPVFHHRSILALLVTLLCAPAAPASPPNEAELPAQIDEASGLAYSTQHPTLLWTHNDNINDPGSMRRVTPFLYGISPDGQPRVRVELTGLTQRDWEAIESTRLDGVDTLVVADSGDNLGSWPDYALWFIPEPETLPASGRVSTSPTALLRYRYPDGPADTEAMAIDTASGEVLLLSKREDPPRLFSLPLSARHSYDADHGDSDRERLRESPVHEARPVGPMGGLVPTDPINWLLSPLTGRQTSLPTDMALSPNGRVLGVLTYSSLYFFHREPGEGWAEAIRRPIASRSLPRIEQWEGLAFSADGRYVSIVREGTGAGTMRYLEIPEAARSVTGG